MGLSETAGQALAAREGDRVRVRHPWPLLSFGAVHVNPYGNRLEHAAFLDIAARHKLRVEIQAYPLDQANEALADLRAGRVQGAAILLPGPERPGQAY